MSAPPTTSLDLSFLRDRKVQRRVLAVALAFGLLGFLYGTFAPKWYRAGVTLVPTTPQKGGSALAGILGGDMGGIAASLGASVGGADVARIAAVLKSNTVSDAIVQKFDLMKRYRARFVESARDELWSHCDVTPLPKPNLVMLSCEDRDPALVEAMLAQFVEIGNRVFRQVGSGSASEEARFLEARVAELKRQAEEASAAMRAFQETHQIVDIDTQARAVVAAMAAVNAQRIAKQVELGWARTYASRDEASSRQAEAQIAVMEDQLRDLEANDLPAPGAGTGKSGSNVFPKALAVPRLRAEFEKLYRNRKVTETLLVFAMERLEGARANEARDVSTFQVLDPPATPTRPARPRRAETTFTAMLAGLLLALGWEGYRAWRASRLPAGPLP